MGASSLPPRSDRSAHLPRRGLFPSRAPALRRSTRGFRIRGCRPHGSPHPRLRPLLKDAARSGSAPPDTPRNRYHEGFRRSPRIRLHPHIRVHSRTILKRPDSQAMENMEWLFVVFSEERDGVLSRQFCLHDFMPPLRINYRNYSSTFTYKLSGKLFSRSAHLLLNSIAGRQKSHFLEFFARNYHRNFTISFLPV